ncbi:InlB B-repeat-containing protein [Bifidobacterium aemilianum]|uniref:InlB B-repeat-containing protein n=1 Tax=Bifidobacterium aemilianum TaxID=2493120 RepID=UPI0038B386B9
MQAFTELTELDLGDNDITDVSPLASLTKLQKLWLNNNHIENLRTLGNMSSEAGASPLLPALSYLDASGQSIYLADAPLSSGMTVTFPSYWAGEGMQAGASSAANNIPNTARGFIPTTQGSFKLRGSGSWACYSLSEHHAGIDPLYGPENIDGCFQTSGFRRRTIVPPFTANLLAPISPGTYRYGFRSQGVQHRGNSFLMSPNQYWSAVTTPAGGPGTFIFSGIIEQTLYGYKVTYYPGNGDPTWEEHLTSDYATLPSPDPVRPGYQFMGWYTSGGSQWNFGTKVTADMTLYGHWQKLPVVTFHPGNGDPDTTATVPSIGGDISTIAPTPTRQYHDFTGWWTAPTGGTQWSTGTPVNTDMDLYGQWKHRTHTVTIDPNGGSGGPPSPITVNEGDPAGPISPTPTWAGHSISGWTTGGGATWNPASDPVLADMTIKAKWEADQYTVRFLAPGLTPNPTITDQTGINYGTGLITDPGTPTGTFPNEATPTFNGWWTTPTTGGRKWDFTTSHIGPDEINDTSHTMTLYARYTHRVTITYDLGDATGQVPPITSQTIDKNDTLLVNSLPTPGVWTGHTFQGWHTDTNLTQPWRTGPVTSNTTLHAKWATTHTVTAHANYPGANPATWTLHVGDGDSAMSALYGEITIPTRTGWWFDDWYTDPAATTHYNSQPITADTDLYMGWTRAAYTLTLDPNGGTWPDGTTGSKNQTVTEGDPATMPDPPTKPGWILTGWTNNGADFDPTTTPITDWTYLKAKWAPAITQLPLTGGPLGAWTLPTLGTLLPLTTLTAIGLTHRRKQTGHNLRH